MLSSVASLEKSDGMGDDDKQSYLWARVYLNRWENNGHA